MHVQKVIPNNLVNKIFEILKYTYLIIHSFTYDYYRSKVSLNEVSHNSAIDLIKRVMAAGVNLQQVFVDTVGPPEKYQVRST